MDKDKDEKEGGPVGTAYRVWSVFTFYAAIISGHLNHLIQRRAYAMRVVQTRNKSWCLAFFSLP